MNNLWPYFFQFTMKNGVAGNCGFFKKKGRFVNGRYGPLNATAP